MSEKKIHRSKGIVERNVPRWFRKQGFKPWDDFCAFFAGGGAGADAAIAEEWKDLDEKGDDAQPKALGHLIKFYNKNRKFPKTEVAPPWFFVEGSRRENLPADDAWTIDLANELDHERSLKPAQPRAPKGKGDRGAPKGEGAPATAPAEGAAPAADKPEPPAVGVVPPPASDSKWQEALRRLPGAIQLLVDGRGKNASELNDRRRKALDLAQYDRIHQLQKYGGEIRKEILTWLSEKKRSAEELEAEIKRRAGEMESWIKTQLEAAQKKVALDEHAREELKTRIRKQFPKALDDNALVRFAKQALDASRPLRRGSWAKKVIDDFNASRGSAAEKIRDPRIIDGLVQWLTSKKEEDTPTDGEIYDQIQRMGGPNMAARKRRVEGPKPPKPKDQRDPRLIQAELEEREDARAAERAARTAAQPAKAKAAAPAEPAAPAPAAPAPAAPAAPEATPPS